MTLEILRDEGNLPPRPAWHSGLTAREFAKQAKLYNLQLVKHARLRLERQAQDQDRGDRLAAAMEEMTKLNDWLENELNESPLPIVRYNTMALYHRLTESLTCAIEAAIR